MCPGYVVCQEMAILLTKKAKPQAISSKRNLEHLLTWTAAQNNLDILQYLIEASEKVPQKACLRLLCSKDVEQEAKMLIRRALYVPKSLKSWCRLALRRHAAKINPLEKYCYQNLPLICADFVSLSDVWNLTGYVYTIWITFFIVQLRIMNIWFWVSYYIFYHTIIWNGMNIHFAKTLKLER